MSKENPRNEDYHHLAGLISAALTLWIMVAAFDGYFNAVLGYFERRLPYEAAYLATFTSYGLGAGIAYKFFKIVLFAILSASAINAFRGGSPAALLGF